jgi:anti-sigma factor RsiW
MNCEEAQETMLDSLTGPISAERRLLMENHIAACEACRQFAEVQRMLDARLAAAVPVVSLSAGFRRALQEKLRQAATPDWPESLPDIAHLIGCGFAIALLLVLLPQYSKTVVFAGAGFTAVTYFLQAALRSSFESAQ